MKCSIINFLILLFIGPSLYGQKHSQIPLNKPADSAFIVYNNKKLISEYFNKEGNLLQQIKPTEETELQYDDSGKVNYIKIIKGDSNDRTNVEQWYENGHLRRILENNLDGYSSEKIYNHEKIETYSNLTWPSGYSITSKSDFDSVWTRHYLEKAPNGDTILWKKWVNDLLIVKKAFKVTEHYQYINGRQYLASKKSPSTFERYKYDTNGDLIYKSSLDYYSYDTWEKWHDSTAIGTTLIKKDKSNRIYFKDHQINYKAHPDELANFQYIYDQRNKNYTHKVTVQTKLALEYRRPYEREEYFDDDSSLIAWKEYRFKKGKLSKHISKDKGGKRTVEYYIQPFHKKVKNSIVRLFKKNERQVIFSRTYSCGGGRILNHQKVYETSIEITPELIINIFDQDLINSLSEEILPQQQHLQELLLLLKSQLKYPTLASDNLIEGTLFINLEIKNNRIINYQVLRSPYIGFDEEFKRLRLLMENKSIDEIEPLQIVSFHNGRRSIKKVEINNLLLGIKFRVD